MCDKKAQAGAKGGFKTQQQKTKSAHGLTEADIDFLLREDKFLNILEGKYGGKKKRAFKEVGVNAHVQSVTEKDKERMNEFKKELERKGLPTQF